MKRWLAYLLFLAIHSSVSVLAWDEKPVDPVSRSELEVKNPARPIQGRLTIELEELWRVGGFSEAPEEMFGVISDLAVDALGNVYLLDLQLAEAKVFSPGGEYLRTIGREGDGPGQLRRPLALFVLPDQTLCIVQPNANRLSLFDNRGNYLREMSLSDSTRAEFQAFSDADSRGGNVVLMGSQARMGTGFMDREIRIVAIASDGNVSAEYARADCRIDFSERVVREREANPLSWTLGPDGRVYVNRSYDYRIEVSRPDGTLDLIVTREYEHRVRTAEEMEVVRQYFRRGGGTEGGTLDISNHDRDIQWMTVTDKGELWVLSSHGAHSSSKRAMGTFDVYDAQGRFQREIVLKGIGDPLTDRFYLARDRWYVVRHYEEAFGSRAAKGAGDSSSQDGKPAAEPMSVICYRLP